MKREASPVIVIDPEDVNLLSTLPTKRVRRHVIPPPRILPHLKFQSALTNATIQRGPGESFFLTPQPIILDACDEECPLRVAYWPDNADIGKRLLHYLDRSAVANRRQHVAILDWIEKVALTKSTVANDEKYCRILNIDNPTELGHFLMIESNSPSRRESGYIEETCLSPFLYIHKCSYSL